MRERLEMICKNMEKLEGEISDVEDKLYHLRLELQVLIKDSQKSRSGKNG